MLAEVAAIRRIFDVIGVLHFLRRDEFMTKVVAFHEIQSDLPLMAGIAWAFGRHGHCVRLELLMGNQGKIRTVHTAAKCHDTGFHLAQNAPEVMFLLKHPNIVTESLKPSNDKGLSVESP